MRTAIMLTALVLSAGAQSAEPTAAEREERKIVSRMYQATEATAATCPASDQAAFAASLKRIRETFPDFVERLEASPFRAQAIADFADDLERARHEPEAERSARCLYMKSMIDAMVDTEAGRESVQQMASKLAAPAR